MYRLAWFLLVVFAFHLCPQDSAAQAAGQAPRLGEPFPSPTGITWLGEAPRPLRAGGRVTLIEFWASWSPASRLLLAEQDSLLAARPELPLDILAISHEEPAALRAFLAEAGWTRLQIGSDAARAYWQATFGAVTEPKDGRRGALPFAFIVGETAAGPGRLLWMGPLIEIYDEDPHAAFATALAAALDGSFDLAAAQEAIRQEERSVAIFSEFSLALEVADYPRIDILLDELASLRIHYMFRRTVASNLGGLVWSLLAEGNPSPAAQALAEKAVALTLEHGGDETDPGVLITRARSAQMRGDLAEAIALQRRAVAMVPAGHYGDPLRATLSEYLAAAGLPPEPAAPPAATPSTAVWSGNLNATTLRLRGPEALYVRPLPPADSTLARRWDEEIIKLRQRFYGQTTLALPDTLTDAHLTGRPLLLYGTPAANPVLERVLAAQDIALQADGVRFGAVFFPAENPVLIAAVPNPITPALPASVHTAFREEDALGTNRFFHGPSGVMVGHWEGDKPVVLAALDFEPGAPDAQGRLALALGPSELGAAEAQADLTQLHTLLAENYAGYGDLAWDLGQQGSSWAARTADLHARLGERERWSGAEFFAQVLDYLAPVQDTHFFIQGSSLVAGRYEERKQTLVRQWRPFFTGIRLRETATGLRVVEAPPGCAFAAGDALAAPSLLESPHAVADGEARLFSTLPARTGEREYLLGCLSTEAGDSLLLSLASSGPRLPAHRGLLARSPRSREPWSMAQDAATGWATVSLRTMSQGSLAGFPESADSLRAAAGLTLDLRGNGGGSDTPGMQWVQRLSSQPIDWVGHVFAWPEGKDAAGSSISNPGRRELRIAGDKLPQAPAPFTRPVQVLMDKGVASSGETMVLLAGQLPGAILFGENTAGCSAYGNVQELGPLAHSRIRLHCGRSRFVQDWVRPMREGVGFFPDYWLDTEDPLALLAARRDLEKPAP